MQPLFLILLLSLWHLLRLQAMELLGRSLEARPSFSGFGRCQVPLMFPSQHDMLPSWREYSLFCLWTAEAPEISACSRTGPNAAVWQEAYTAILRRLEEDRGVRDDGACSYMLVGILIQYLGTTGQHDTLSQASAAKNNTRSARPYTLQSQS